MVGLLSLGLLAFAQDEDKAHVRVFEKIRPSIVAVRSEATLGGEEISGTGIFLDENGLILTHYWVVPEGAQKIRVWTTEPRLYEAEVVAHSQRDDLTLMRIKAKGKVKPIEWGDSTKVKIGDVAYTVGNAENAMINDNQPAFNFGIISGLYNLKQPRSTSYYTGWVLETTAAVNEKMEGAPVLDSRGRVVGLVTLNYSPHRFLGNAIPSNALQTRIEQMLKDAKAAAEAAKPIEGAGYLGLSVKATEQGLVVDRVDKDGPADLAGIKPGNRILVFRGKTPANADEFRAALADLKVGDYVFLKVDFGSFVQEIKVELGSAPEEKK